MCGRRTHAARTTGGVLVVRRHDRRVGRRIAVHVCVHAQDIGIPIAEYVAGLVTGGRVARAHRICVHTYS